MTDTATPDLDRRALDIEAVFRDWLAAGRGRAAWLWATAFVVAVVGLYFYKAEYSATGAFTTSSRRPNSGLSGLAAQVGLTIPGVESTNSPQFYADLLQSDEILRRVSARHFHTQASGREAATLGEIWHVNPADSVLAAERILKRLRASVVVSASQRTGIITYVVRARDPLLAEELAKAFLEELDSFNRNTRNSQAAAERRFTEGRLEEARNALRASEDSLEAFFQRNRLFEGSPALMFRRDRLARDVTAKEELANLLSQSYEQARIEEVRDTPVLTSLESPRHSATRDSGNLPLVLILAAGFAFAVVAVDVLVTAARRRRLGLSAPLTNDGTLLRNR